MALVPGLLDTVLLVVMAVLRLLEPVLVLVLANLAKKHLLIPKLCEGLVAFHSKEFLLLKICVDMVLREAHEGEDLRGRGLI